MSILAILGGVSLLLLVVTDILWTTLWIQEDAGPLTTRVARHASRAITVLLRLRHPISLLGPAILVITIVSWISLLWAGWVMIFSAEHSAVVGSSDQIPASWADRVYFVGYLIFTLGNGEFMPNGDIWQIAMVLASGSGLLLLTLIITYMISVLSAVVGKRSFASQVTGIGRSAEEFIHGGWDGRNFHALDLPLSTYSTSLSQITEQHFAYPILHYYRGTRTSKSPAVAVVVLDEALTVLRYGIPADLRPNLALLSSTRAAIGSYLDTLENFIDMTDPAPPVPALARLRQTGIPTVADDEFMAEVVKLTERRRRLLGLVRNEGWDWPNQ